MKKPILILALVCSTFFTLSKSYGQTTNQPEDATAQSEVVDSVDNAEYEEETDNNAFLIGLGYGVETGLLGIQYRILFTDNIYVQTSALVDLLGFGWGYGLGFQTNPWQDDKCLWFFKCNQRLRFSVGYNYYGGSKYDLSSSGETECEDGFCISTGGGIDGARYDISSSHGMMGTVALQSQVGSTFFYEFQAGLWTSARKPSYSYLSGPQTPKDQDSLDSLSKTHIALGVTTGWYFW